MTIDIVANSEEWSRVKFNRVMSYHKQIDLPASINLM